MRVRWRIESWACSMRWMMDWLIERTIAWWRKMIEEGWMKKEEEGGCWGESDWRRRGVGKEGPKVSKQLVARDANDPSVVQGVVQVQQRYCLLCYRVLHLLLSREIGGLRTCSNEVHARSVLRLCLLINRCKRDKRRAALASSLWPMCNIRMLCEAAKYQSTAYGWTSVHRFNELNWFERQEEDADT